MSATDRWLEQILAKSKTELAGRDLPGFGMRAWVNEPSPIVRAASVGVVAHWAYHFLHGQAILPARGTRAGDELRRQAIDEHCGILHADAVDRVQRNVRCHSYAERRRLELEEALRPRPGDFMGRDSRRDVA
jgi:hypothetical protein